MNLGLRICGFGLCFCGSARCCACKEQSGSRFKAVGLGAYGLGYNYTLTLWGNPFLGWGLGVRI